MTVAARTAIAEAAETTIDAPDPAQAVPSVRAGAEAWQAMEAQMGIRAMPPGSLSAGGSVLAITSGKGGVGKSNISASLSLLLSQSGVRVALLDADLGLGNLDVILGVSAGANLSEVMAGRRSVEQVLVRLPSGLHLAAGSTGPVNGGRNESLARALLAHGLLQVRQKHDLTILDCGSGIGRDVMEMCFLAEHVLVVTTPEPTAMTDAYGLIKSLNRDGHTGRISVLVNMAGSREEAKATYARLANVAGKFLDQTIFDAGYVLADVKVPLAVRRRRPFVLEFPHCNASRSLSALAMKLRPKGCCGQKKSSWLGRVAAVLGKRL